VVFLYYRDDMAVGDIARALGVTTGTVKTLLFRARRRLRERLGDITEAIEEASA
jgi:DNA-directed RNA polymerase specialized sigma24 family protein